MLVPYTRCFSSAYDFTEIFFARTICRHSLPPKKTNEPIVKNHDTVQFAELPTSNSCKIGLAQLDAPKTLNALTVDMVRLLDGRFSAWSEDPTIACVILRGVGDRAFCSGGDVRKVREQILTEHTHGFSTSAVAFFSEEYRLDYHIHTYAKPIVVWGSGVIMGGGLGLLVGGSHRVVTESSRIAMPEIAIGLFPDVGASWFLRRMRGRTGLFAGLTGVQLNANDALFAGLADYFVTNSDWEEFLRSVLSQRWTGTEGEDGALISETLKKFEVSAKNHLPTSNLSLHEETIDAVTHGDQVEEIVNRIIGSGDVSPWFKTAAEKLSTGSPTSMALAWELQQRAKDLSLAEVFRLELVVAVRCSAHSDFLEGVRARLVDKDNAPRWMPRTLAEVQQKGIDEYFASPWSEAEHPLRNLGENKTG